MTKESQAPVDDYRWRAADLVARKSEQALAAIREQRPTDALYGLDALIEETERALEMASRALAEHQIEEN